MKKVVLIGFAAVGKSTVGKLLAEKLNLEFVDTDEAIQYECKSTIKYIFAEYGEEYFREKENKLLTTLSCKQDTVVACGGGTVTVRGFKAFAFDCIIIWLSASVATIQKRLGNVSRPLFDGLDVQQLTARVNARAPYYKRYANLTISTDDLTPEQICDQIKAFIENH